MTTDVLDLKSPPINGRYFPLSYSDLVCKCKELGIKQESGKRIAIQMKNARSKNVIMENDWVLAEIDQMNDIMAFSVPSTFNKDVTSKAMLDILSFFTTLNLIPLKELPTIGQFFQARLENQTSIVLYHVLVHNKPKAYFKERRGKVNAWKHIKTEHKKIQVIANRIQYLSK